MLGMYMVQGHLLCVILLMLVSVTKQIAKHMKRKYTEGIYMRVVVCKRLIPGTSYIVSCVQNSRWGSLQECYFGKLIWMLG